VSQDQPVALIVGAGDFIGSAIARRFADGGYTVCMGRRNGDKLNALADEIKSGGGRAHPFSLDAREEDQVVDLFARIETDIGPLDVVIFNPGGNVSFPIRETTTRVFTKVASVRGGAGYAAFSSAKAGLRNLAQAMSRELGPSNIHVAHLIIDAGVDTAWVREMIEKATGEDSAEIPPDVLMKPESVGNAYWQLHNQSRDAWTFEMDLRPYGEKW
jgi:NAD(P)-dependent dehydrogenase (short-subunit alcohol dehydrogenase family)